MDKTININIAGTLFKIDEEAYRILRDYLQAINNRFRNVQGGNETIEDIESRIAEIFDSQKGLAGVISRENIESMISIIGNPEDFDSSGEAVPPPVYGFQKKRMYRNPDDSIISGVCGGIGAYLNTDPVLFRILFALLAFSGVGFFIYIALWIALPEANTEARKREMYGNAYHSARSYNRHTGESVSSGAPQYNSGYYNTSRIGNAFNEIFRAIGRVSYIALRILLIIIGGTFVLTGFLFILSFVMIFILRFPGVFSTDAFDVNLVYFPDFLHYIITPSLVPWVIGLTIIAVVMPLLAFIYWGIKMIFWFKAKDGVFTLIALILWVITVAALSIILFTEGISFAESAKSSSQNTIKPVADTLYIKAGRKVSDLKFDKELSLKEECYTVYSNEEKGNLYIVPCLNVYRSDNNEARIDLRKHSSGRTKSEALKKTNDLIYSYSSVADTLFLDEYFTIPEGRRWSADYVGINIYLPEGTIFKFDTILEDSLFPHYNRYNDEEYSEENEAGKKVWIITEDGPELLLSGMEKHK